MTPEELDNQIRTLIEIVEDCVEIPLDDLVSNSHWKQLNLKSTPDNLGRAFGLFNNFLALPTEALPEQAVQLIIQSLKPLQKTINQIKSLDDTKPLSIAVNADIIKRLKREIDDFCAVAQEWVDYLINQNNKVLASMNKLSSATAEAGRILTDAKAKKDEIDKEAVAANKAAEIANKAALSAKKAAVFADIKHFTEKFSKETDILEKTAIRWLKVTGALGVATLIAAFIFLFLDLGAKDGYTAVQLITARLIVLGVLLSATVWCGRIYKALRHQITINRHRVNSIDTFQTFTEAASSNVIRDAVLTETTKAIFGPSATGYLDKETVGSGGDQLKVIEVVKQASKNLKPGSD